VTAGQGEIADQTPAHLSQFPSSLLPCNTPTDVIDSDIASAITGHIRLIGVGQGKLEGNETIGGKEKGFEPEHIRHLWTPFSGLIIGIFTVTGVHTVWKEP
jgi:hypothetical protein